MRWQAQRRVLAVLMAFVAAAGLWHVGQRPMGSAPPLTHLALLVPDRLDEDDTHVRAWRAAAAEMALPLQVVAASELLRPGGRHRDAALIVPDAVHQRMNDALIANLEQRVRDGALLMLLHDAGVANMHGRYHPRRSRLSALAGVDYALYGRLGAGMLIEQGARLEARVTADLRRLPGETPHDRDARVPTDAQPSMQPAEERAAVGTPEEGLSASPVYATQGNYDGRVLMRSLRNDLVAGVRQVGNGRVLFVNLPLSRLQLRNDGPWLQRFLRFFADDMAGLPHSAQRPTAERARFSAPHAAASRSVETPLQGTSPLVPVATSPDREVLATPGHGTPAVFMKPPVAGASAAGVAGGPNGTACSAVAARAAPIPLLFPARAGTS